MSKLPAELNRQNTWRTKRTSVSRSGTAISAEWEKQTSVESGAEIVVRTRTVPSTFAKEVTTKNDFGVPGIAERRRPRKQL